MGRLVKIFMRLSSETKASLNAFHAQLCGLWDWRVSDRPVRSNGLTRPHRADLTAARSQPVKMKSIMGDGRKSLKSGEARMTDMLGT
jgi:hypothetical protein